MGKEDKATTEEPKHEHSWDWVETKAAWTETVDHPAEGYYKCNCGATK